MNLFGEEEQQQEYQVLARKYRPKKLEELIGQDVLVRTIANAIEMNKIPHAFVLTGIRGVGKTSTARIIARSLLCTGEDGKNTKPTVNPCGVCANCRSIAEDRNVDVVEVDAASRTGVDDIREIIDQVVYAPVQGRYKVFIIDEVHMLSKNAFNALLKTLEEPPHHVKFIFATTEIRKIPVTILSRCMRFDLPRVSVEKLVTHFGNISKKENAIVNEEALTMIAKASEGSVRDGLSLLDQAISISAGEEVTQEKVRNMLGLADRERTLQLFETIVAGDAEGSINIVKELYNLGVEPVIILQDVLEIVHFVTQSKISNEYMNLGFVTESERNLAKKYIGQLEVSYLSRLWQMLTKGITEAKFTSNSLIAAEMVLIRICYGAALPTPEQILSRLDLSGAANSNQVANLAAQKKTELNSQPALKENINQPSNQHREVAEPDFFPQVTEKAPEVLNHPSPVEGPANFIQLAELLRNKGEFFLAAHVEDVIPVSFDRSACKIEFTPSNLTPKTLATDLSERLFAWTGTRWFVVLNTSSNKAEASKSLRTEKEELLDKKKEAALQDKFVKELLETFPESKVINVQENFEEHQKNQNKNKR